LLTSRTWLLLRGNCRQPVTANDLTYLTKIVK
jgi:hypothetical protein